MSSGEHYFENGMAVDAVAGSAEALREVLDGCHGRCVRIFVAGAVTHVGKTTVCLSLLAALRRCGLTAAELAYIKPATQCEAPDLLEKWCADEGVEHVAGEKAPLVFYQGFTRSFLDGQQGTSADWMAKIAKRVDELAENRRVLVVDGVGFPAVGSIVGVDNADVARACRAPVLLVCKSGVGGAVDSFSLNSSYFLAKGVPVLGGVFNFGDIDGFNSHDFCREYINKWFAAEPRRHRSYGVIPVTPELDGLREKISEASPETLGKMAALNASHFAKHADVAAMLADAAADAWNRAAAAGAAGKQPAKPVAAAPGGSFKPKAREQVAQMAKTLGAKGGG